MEEIKKKERDFSIDFLRFIGLAAIILAHSDIPKLLFQLRNFDVPLMVFVSGYSAYNFSTKSKDTWAYVSDRFLRLVVPTWIFVTLYAVLRWTLGDGISTVDVIESYLMTGGPLGVWIIRIFFFMSLLTPIMMRVAQKDSKLLLLLVIIAIMLVGNEIVSQYFKELPRPRTIPVRLVFIFLLYNCSYGLVLFFGMIWNKLNRNGQYLFTFACLTCFLFLAAYYLYASGEFVWTQEYKNPPMMYYLSFALLIISLLFISKGTKLVKSLSKFKFITFVGSHTLWIYLWHWLFLYYCDQFLPSIDQWIYKFLFLFTGATIVTLLQVRIFRKLAPLISPDYRGVLAKMFIG